MFNNVGRCTHIRPIIGCKGNACIAGCQTNGWAMATMYGFALYTLPERFALRRFAIVYETGIGNFKGLNGVIWTDLRKCSLRNRRTPQATTPTPNAATQVWSGRIMPDFAFLCITDTWNSRNGFSGLRHSRPPAATSCHLIANLLFHADNWFTLQAKRIINTKISI